MADTTIRTTMCFARRHADARIECRRCKRVVDVPGAQIAAMFPRPMPIAMAEQRLRCSRCQGKWAAITPVMPPRRD